MPWFPGRRVSPSATRSREGDGNVMRLFCSMGWHRPSAQVIENEGRTFSRCRSCGADLVKASHGWKVAPKGYRVIWKKPAKPVLAADPAPVEETEKPVPAKAPRARRKQPDRRKSAEKTLPTHLAGKDRRKGAERRRGFGKKPDQADE